MGLSKKEQAMLDSLGIKLTNDDYVRPVEEEEHTKEMAKWEAQSLLVSLNWPYPEMMSQVCKNPECKQRFLTNYKANVYCSMRCFKVELEKIGIVWRPERSFYEQWGNLEPPLMIPPEAIKAMRRLLSIVDQETPAQSHSPEPDFAGVSREQLLISEEPVLPDHPIDPGIQEEHDEGFDDDFFALLDAQDES